jgi:hypothetical protein
MNSGTVQNPKFGGHMPGANVRHQRGRHVLPASSESRRLGNGDLGTLDVTDLV